MRTIRPDMEVRVAKRDSDSRKALDSVAETVGTNLGLLLNQIEDQVHMAGGRRDAAIKNLLAIRGKATQLLTDLGHSISEMPLPGRKPRPARAKKAKGSARPRARSTKPKIAKKTSE